MRRRRRIGTLAQKVYDHGSKGACDYGEEAKIEDEIGGKEGRAKDSR
jgi:hypothetical protein